MGIEYSSIVDAPRDEVFAWYSRPGAIHRLVPPWQPMRVVSEARSIADGRAVLALAGGVRWVAQHQAGEYDPPRRFVDVRERAGARSLPTVLAGRWRHEHTFEDLGDGRTRVVDRVETAVPERALRKTFAYRHRQLADDLASHRWARTHGTAPATVAITGSSGLVGTALTAFLSTGGYRVIRLVRHAPRDAGERQWDPFAPAPDLLQGVDAVVHLAGVSIAGRFTDTHVAAVRDSRIEPTKRLAECAAVTPGVTTFVSASAIGWYGFDCGSAELGESVPAGGGVLADLVSDWEAATEPAALAGLRVVRVRTGVVQSPRGGALRLMRPLFAAGLGGRLGGGRQWFSWIDLDDLVDVYARALADPGLSGPVNAVAPNPVTNAEYTRVLAHVLHRPAVLPVPRFGPAVLLGRQGARELALADQRVLPERLLAAGHAFRRPDLEDCLRHQLGHAQL